MKYYGHRVTEAERKAIDSLYAPAPGRGRFLLDVKSLIPEVHYIASEPEAIRVAKSWHSRGVRVTVTDTRTRKVIFPV